MASLFYFDKTIFLRFCYERKMRYVVITHQKKTNLIGVNDETF